MPDFNATVFQPGSFGLYVHVPFCAHTCDFCAFYQVEPRRDDITRYLKTIAAEMDLVSSRRCDTAFWGGGTPGLLAAADLERLGEIQKKRFGRPADEWSIELAPGSVKSDKLDVLRQIGITRVSLGVQSFSEKLLDKLGRRHSPKQIIHAWDQIRSAGFSNVNIDLMFALPGQSMDDWRKDLAAAIALGPEHISTYCLTFEEDTALYVQLSEGTVKQDDLRDRHFYETTWEVLGEAGYRQYEISNHARPGHECRHNLNTWRMHGWQGFGPSAASQGQDWRGSNPHDLNRWISDITAGRRAQADRSHLTPASLVEDALIFGLRMNRGVSLTELCARFGASVVAPFRPLIESLQGEGLAVVSESEVVQLTNEGRLLADAVGAELIGCAGSRAG